MIIIGELVERLESAYKTLSKCEEAIKELQDERDMYLAELQKANAAIIDFQRNPPKYTQHHLAEIRAEAGRAGFVAGSLFIRKGQHVSLIEAADKYADQIRREVE